MIPFASLHAALPLAPGGTVGMAPASSASPGTREPGAVPAGQFAEVFASMMPTSTVPGDPGATAGIAADTDIAAPVTPANGASATRSAEIASRTQQLAETAAPDSRTPRAPAPEAGAVMTQRAQHPALSDLAHLPPESVTATGTGNEQASDTTESVAVEQTAGSGARHPFPVAVAPLLLMPMPGTVDAPEFAQLPVASVPLLVLPIPDGGASLPVAPTPGASVTDHDLGAAPSPQARAVSTEAEPADTATATATGTNAPAPFAGQLGAPVPDAVVQVQVHLTAPDSTSADAQHEPGAGGQIPAGHTAATLAGPEEVPAASNAGSGPIPAVAGQGEARTVTAGAAASPGAARDAGIQGVDALESSAAQLPPVRNQAPAPLHRQLLGPIASLAAGPHGERTLSVNIAPEALGPITVKAVLGGEGIRMELSAPTDAGREALRAMLPDLRRELAATGPGTIMLSTGADSPSTQGGQTGSQGGSQNDGGGDARPFTGTHAPGLRARGEPGTETPGRETSLALHDTSHLDVMA